MSEFNFSSTDSEAELDLAAAFRTLRKYKYFIFAATGLCAAISLVALTAPLVYRAQVTLTQVNDTNMNPAASLANQFGGLASLAGINLGRGGADPDAQAILASRHLVQEFIERNKLLPQLSHDADKPLSLWKTVEKFKDEIVSIREEKRTGTTTIAISWSDPAVAARWANDFVALANELIRARAIADSSRNIAYLNDQISHTKVVELQSVMYKLIENEMKTLMLANARAEYAFAVVDPAVPPEVRLSPKRTIIVLFGVVLGFIVGCCIAIAHNSFVKNKPNLKEQQG